MSETAATNASDVRRVLAEALGRDVADLRDELVLTDLVAESFALIEVVIQLQETLKIRLVQDDLRDVSTVGDLVRVCAERL